jgi:hypothetical protein
MLEAFCYSQPTWASSDEAVARWVRGLIPDGVDEDPEPSRTGRSERSIGEVLQGGSQQRQLRTDPAALPEEPRPEPTIRPPVTIPKTRWAVLASLALLAAALLGGAIVKLASGGRDPDARTALYLEEATRLAQEGHAEEARKMLDRAEAAGADDPNVVIGISRLRSTISAAP